jgi:ribonucleoside-triphosphate reductase
LFIHWFNEARSETLLTFPVETMALLIDGKDVIDKKYKDLTTEMYAAGHSFFTYLSDNPDSLASCRRLRNQINENVFSFTNGLTGVQTGSCNVITINLNRVIQN